MTITYVLRCNVMQVEVFDRHVEGIILGDGNYGVATYNYMAWNGCILGYPVEAGNQLVCIIRALHEDDKRTLKL